MAAFLLFLLFLSVFGYIYYSANKNGDVYEEYAIRKERRDYEIRRKERELEKIEECRLRKKYEERVKDAFAVFYQQVTNQTICSTDSSITIIGLKRQDLCDYVCHEFEKHMIPVLRIRDCYYKGIHEFAVTNNDSYELYNLHLHFQFIKDGIEYKNYEDSTELTVSIQKTEITINEITESHQSSYIMWF